MANNFLPKQVEVGGRTVIISRCSATEALDLQLSLARVAGGAAGAVIGGDTSAGIVAALGGLASKLTHAELLRLMHMVFQYVMIDGQKVVNIDLTFADRPRDLWEVFVACLSHNLGPLVDWLRERSQSLNLTQGSPGSSP